MAQQAWATDAAVAARASHQGNALTHTVNSASTWQLK
jgi:hypothetical protein